MNKELEVREDMAHIERTERNSGLLNLESQQSRDVAREVNMEQIMPLKIHQVTLDFKNWELLKILK